MAYAAIAGAALSMVSGINEGVLKEASYKVEALNAKTKANT